MFADTLILGTGISLLVLRRIPYWIRASAVVAICYLLGFVLFLALGPDGAGIVWLFTAPVLAGVLGGTRAACAALALNGATIVAFCLLILSKGDSIAALADQPVEKWIVIGLNFMLLNSLVAICVALPLRGLQRSLQEVQSARTSLERNHEQLAATHAELRTADSKRSKAENELKEHYGQLEDLVEKRTAELASTNQELESFAYSVSHDLRAPLRALDGFSQVLIEDYSEVLGEEGRAHLERIRAADARMGTLIDALLELSRLSRGELKRETLDLSRDGPRARAPSLRRPSPERHVELVVAEGLEARADRELVARPAHQPARQRLEVHRRPRDGARSRSAPPRSTASAPSSCATTAPASTWPTPRSSSAPSSACTARASSRASASASPPCSASCVGMADGCGPKARWSRARRSSSRCRRLPARTHRRVCDFRRVR